MQPQYIPLGNRARDLSGQRFGRLIALGPIRKNKHNHYVWHCCCDCGKEVEVDFTHLLSGGTRSCGCLHRDVAGEARATHHMSKHPLYNVWAAMKNRCSNPANPSYVRYGKRGIEVCPAWRKSFVAFLEYITALPDYGVAGRTLDRVNNDGNYEPGNLRWATCKTQNGNTRTNRHVTAFGRTQILEDWAREVGIPSGALGRRLTRGMDPEDALTAPYKPYTKRKVSA